MGGLIVEHVLDLLLVAATVVLFVLLTLLVGVLDRPGQDGS